MVSHLFTSLPSSFTATVHAALPDFIFLVFVFLLGMVHVNPYESRFFAVTNNIRISCLLFCYFITNPSPFAAALTPPFLVLSSFCFFFFFLLGMVHVNPYEPCFSAVIHHTQISFIFCCYLITNPSPFAAALTQPFLVLFAFCLFLFFLLGMVHVNPYESRFSAVIHHT